MVAILLDQVLDLPSVCIFLALVVQMQDDCCSASGALGLFYCIFVLSVTDPLVGLIASVGSGDDLHLVCDHECRVETYTELTDEVAVLLLVLREILQKVLGSGPGNCSEVLGKLVMSHSDSIILDCQCAVLTFGEAEIYPELAFRSLSVDEGLVLQLVQCIGCIRDQLPEEYLLM